MLKKSEVVVLKDDKWLERQKIAGQCVAEVLKTCGELVEKKTPNLSLLDLEENALRIMTKFDCTPTFKNYKLKSVPKPFPSAICTSVNKHLVHGIVTDYTLQPSDIVSVDLGATYEGAIADAAYTFVYGETTKEIKEMLNACKISLYKGIEAAKVGNRLGTIGNAIYKSVKDTKFGLVTDYGGHGINYNQAHAKPFVANKDSSNNGIRLQQGMSLAIEPMLTLNKDTSSKILDDQWTVETKTIGCHYEHSIFIENDETIIITEHNL